MTKILRGALESAKSAKKMREKREKAEQAEQADVLSPLFSRSSFFVKIRQATFPFQNFEERVFLSKRDLRD